MSACLDLNDWLKMINVLKTTKTCFVNDFKVVLNFLAIIIIVYNLSK